ncbi:MAG: tRNA (adenosine(37)-N6)-threonylcarbamoyltransferase complex transferase subunit TsaD [Clostridiales Family XIII bacterium]|jgi:N6-L-threonylcarbamoyladenine synthase|nr:tRNA (adenosine(37)-N6)-threonylcarbamoyltransferase complex transferase subunit TsaD [Clostridiales Family XIII bacterium]
MTGNGAAGGGAVLLGIESSCDETAAAVTAGGRTALSNVIASQIDVHKVFGGVVPEIAARHHLTAVNGVVSAALSEAGICARDVDAIAVTKGPGLVGAVLIGLATAKAMAFALGKPLIGVHHIRGHICAAFLEHPALEPPFLSLVVSGGHTSLVDVRDYREMDVLGATRDDAAGEAWDKVARVLGLGYPGGPKVDALAKEGDAAAAPFKRVLLEKDSLDFSFSGIKTGVMNYVNSMNQAGTPWNPADAAAGFQQAVIDVLAAKTALALERTGRRTLTLSGGVAANTALRARMRAECERLGVRIFIPSPIYCTDNAAMIACAGYYDFIGGHTDGLDLDASAVLSMSE